MPTSSRACCGRGAGAGQFMCPTSSRSRACASRRLARPAHGRPPGLPASARRAARRGAAEHRTVLGDLLTARGARHPRAVSHARNLANANPRAIRRAAEEAAPADSRWTTPRASATALGARSTVARRRAARLTSWRTLVSQLSVSPARLTRSTAPRRRCCPPARQAPAL